MDELPLAYKTLKNIHFAEQILSKEYDIN
jgi:hypothetical protein